MYLDFSYFADYFVLFFGDPKHLGLLSLWSEIRGWGGDRFYGEVFIQHTKHTKHTKRITFK